MIKYKQLFRGVSLELYQKLQGLLVPKLIGKPFSSIPQFNDEHAQFGSGIQFGDSIVNEIVKHQHAQKGLPTSGVSSTPIYEKAIYYALANFTYSEGYIYTINVEELIKYSVNIYPVNEYLSNPFIPDDNEHILVSSDYKNIPSATIEKVEHIIFKDNILTKEIFLTTAST